MLLRRRAPPLKSSGARAYGGRNRACHSKGERVPLAEGKGEREKGVVMQGWGWLKATKSSCVCHRGKRGGGGGRERDVRGLTGDITMGLVSPVVAIVRAAGRN